ncbi:hypothetical protein EV127DRAFT_465889 [Xylaria flabelliformis]|nr:hypothetical protein EV127DRAFT_465889 [Xylaria flabelliformis]
MSTAWAYVSHNIQDPGYRRLSVGKKVVVMEVVGAIASFIAIGQAIGVTPKIIKALKGFTNASEEVEALIDELESLYGFYQHMKANIDLFSGEHNTALLRVDEPPYLKLIRRDFESLIVALQELADSCLVDEGNSLKVSKLRWWKRRKHVIKLREECYKQRQRLQDFYNLFRDRFAYKQGEVLVQIHTRTSQGEAQEANALPSPKDRPGTSSNSAKDKALATESDTAPLSPSIEEPKETVGRQCCCFCHARETPTRDYYNRLILLPGYGFWSYQSQMFTGNQCEMKCCTATQSFVALQFRIPMWFRGLAVLGSLTYRFPFHITVYFTPTIQLRSPAPNLQMARLCRLGIPAHLNQWLSRSRSNILSVDERGFSILEIILLCGGYPLLTYCTNTWPGLIKEQSWTRRAATEARLTLLSGHTWINFRPVKLTTSDKYHLTEFLRFIDVDDDSDKLIEAVCAEGSAQSLHRVLPNTADVLTKRYSYGNTVLHYACAFDNVALVQYLSKFKALLNVTNSFGTTPLIMAVGKNAWSSAELLVEKGCQLNNTTFFGDTPLLYAILKIHSGEFDAVRFAKVLVSRGADLGVTNRDGEGVWHLRQRIESHRADLWELYEMMFRAGGARFIDMSTTYGITPLAQAICLYNVPLASFLWKVGARLDNLSLYGSNILHILAFYGDEQSCNLAAKLKISCIDIRTTNDNGITPSACCIRQAERYYQASRDFMSYPEFLISSNYTEDEPGKRQFSQQKLVAFEGLLCGIRNRMLIQEIETLELIILRLRARNLLSARDDLRELAEDKVKAKIYHETATFRAIDLDVREGRLELAIESLEEFIEASKDRMKVSPFDEEVLESSDSGANNLNTLLEDDSDSTSGTESGGEHDTDWNSSGGDERPQDHGDGDDEDSEDDGWETADEGR